MAKFKPKTKDQLWQEWLGFTGKTTNEREQFIRSCIERLGGGSRKISRPAAQFLKRLKKEFPGTRAMVSRIQSELNEELAKKSTNVYVQRRFARQQR